MAYGRLIIGAFVGAAIGAAVWVAVQFFSEREFGWLAVGVGLLAGFIARAAAGKASLGYARGAVPAIVTLLFIVLVNFALFSLLEATGGPRGRTTRITPRSDSSSASDSTKEAETSASDPLVDLTRDSTPDSTARGLRRATDPFSWSTFLWIGIAVLVAYVFGGSDPTEKAEVEAQTEPASDAPSDATAADDSPEPAAEPLANKDES